MATAGSRFTTGLFLMLRALLAYLRAFSDSDASAGAGDTHVRKSVLELPPREFCRYILTISYDKNEYGLYINYIKGYLKKSQTYL